MSDFDPTDRDTRLSQDDFAERARLTPKQLAQLDAICEGRVKRNAGTIIQAMRLRMEYGYAKPKQEVGLVGDVTFNVSLPFAPPNTAGRLVAKPDKPTEVVEHVTAHDDDILDEEDVDDDGPVEVG